MPRALGVTKEKRGGLLSAKTPPAPRAQQRATARCKRPCAESHGGDMCPARSATPQMSDGPAQKPGNRCRLNTH
eukprot:12387236-Alexandrium_andersonii.AAC.1